MQSALRSGQLASAASVTGDWPIYKNFWNDYTALKKIGSGSYGIVLVVRRNLDERLFAVKVLKERDAPIQRELNILEFLTRSSGEKCFTGVICYKGHYMVPELSDTQNKIPKYRIIMMNYVPGSDLLDWIEHWWENHDKAPPSSLVRTMLESALHALSFIHAHGIAHRDIKPDNIQVRKSDGRLVLIDFGMACFSSIVKENPQCKATGIAGTPTYMSPQLLKQVVDRKWEREHGGDPRSPGSNLKKGKEGDIPASAYQSSDVWALGLTFYMLLTGQQTIPDHVGEIMDLIPEATPDQKLRVLSAFIQDYHLPEGSDKNLLPDDAFTSALLRAMVEPNEKKRLTAQEALESLQVYMAHIMQPVDPARGKEKKEIIEGESEQQIGETPSPPPITGIKRQRPF